MAREHSRVASRKRVFLVDDEAVVRRGLKLLCNLQPHLEVCGEAANAQEALHGIVSLNPDLAVVDLNLEGTDGLTLIQELRRLCPPLKILVFTMYDQAHFAAAAFAAGAQGYVTKEEGADKALEAIEWVLNGGYYLSERMAEKAPGLLSALAPHPAKPPL
jgi:DNA-binding NarL/FixJ family response regulator